MDTHAIGKHVSENEDKLRLAHELLNYLISPKVQTEVVVRSLQADPVKSDIRNLLSKEEIVRAHLDDPSYFKTKRILWPVLTVRQRKGVERLWRQALTEASRTAELSKLKSK